MLFGRAQEEISALAAEGIEVEVVPGVTSALAASAEIGTSLTRRGVSRSVTFVTPRVGEGENSNDWALAVAACDTAVIYMGIGEAERIAAALIAAGMRESTPVVVAENASLPERRHIALALRDLRTLSDFDMRGPAVILIGDVFADASIATVRAAPSARCA